VRAAIAARAQVLALGCSGVEPATVELLAGMLNAGIHPIVREVGCSIEGGVQRQARRRG